MVGNMARKDEGEFIKCEYCPIKTKWEFAILDHKCLHDVTPKFDCTKPLDDQDIIVDPRKRNMFSCYSCTFETPSYPTLRKHYISRHAFNKKTYLCCFCQYHSTVLYYLIQHIKFVHFPNQINGFYHCRICRYKTKHKSIFPRHIVYHHILHKKSEYVKSTENYETELELETSPIEKDSELLKCFYCQNYSTYSEQHMVHHLNQHNICFKCPDCDFVAKKKLDLQNHKRHSHKENKMFQCTECDYRSKRQYYVVRHTQDKHCGLKYFCNICKLEFEYASKLRVHNRKKHFKDWYRCPKCSYKAKGKVPIERHLISCHGEYTNLLKFSCPHCPLKTAYYYYLRKHIKKMHTDSKESNK